MMAPPQPERFVYVDEAGEPVGCVDRIDERDGKKSFIQRRRENDAYVSGMKGAKLPLFRLSDLRTRIARGQRVFVVEGERKANVLAKALHDIGFGAAVTTIAGGANETLKPQHIEQLRGGKEFVILADSDAPGRKAARERAEAIAAAYPDAAVRVVDLYPTRDDGLDIADWLGENHSFDEFRALIAAAPRVKTPIVLPHGLDRDLKPSRNGSINSDSASPNEVVEWDDARPWPTLGADAYHGLAGEIVAVVEPETEADPAALLFTVLTVAGNMAGKNTRARVHDDEHPPRLFTTIVGGSNSGAKGTGLAALRQTLRASNEEWFENRLLGGFGSGESIVAELLAKDGQPFDPRLLILETEFARLLAVNNRESSTSSMIIRQAWDGYKLENRRSKDKVVATNHHVSCLAHITPEELLARLTETDSTNGFANRFLFIASKRSKKLPFGGSADREREAVNRFAKRLRVATESAQKSRTITFSTNAREVWDQIYRAEPERGGLVGALTARANAQKLRIAVTYAILDEAGAIEPEHVLAAEACWRYSVATVEHIFGTLRGDSVQDRLLDKLRAVYPRGLTGAEQDELNAKNLPAGRLKGARQALEHAKLIRTEAQPPGEKGGRPSIISYAIPKQTEQPGLTYGAQLIPVNPFGSIEREEHARAVEVASDTSLRETEQPGSTALSADDEARL